MTILQHRRIGGKPWLVNPAVAGAAAPLSDFTLVQPAPAHPLMAANASIGYFTPVGGAGPFRFVQNGDPQSKYQTQYDSGRLSGSYNQLGTTTDTVNVTCSDGTGAFVTKTFTIAKRADSNPVVYFNDRPSIIGAGVGDVQTSPWYQWHVQAFGGSFTGSDSFTVTDPSATFTNFYGVIAPASLAAPPAPGTYPMTATVTSSAGDTLTIPFTITIAAIPALTIQYVSTTSLSSATPIGTIVGKLACTTPFDAPSWSITDPTGTLLIDTVKGNVTVMQTPSAGALPVTFGVTDGAASGSLAKIFTVASGTALAPSSMTMTVNAGLINAGTGQIIGTPAVAGHSGGTWQCLDLTGFNPNAELGYYGCPRRITQDPVTGEITAPGILSAETIQLQVTWVSADGLTSCVQTFGVPVAAAPDVIYYVGQGASTTHGANGFETLATALNFNNANSNRATTFRFKVAASTDPNYYTGDNLFNPQSLNIPGPIHIEGVAANGVAQPRLGGVVGGSGLAESQYGKGPLVFGHGDAILENLEVSDVHGGDLLHGIEGIRKDGQTYGNMTLLNCNVHDCDNGWETGVCHGNMVATNTEFANCGSAHVGSGACHNMYVGIVSSLTLNNVTSRRSTTGHLVKSRAAVTTINGGNFLGTSGGQEGCCLEFPNAGLVTINGSNVQHSVMAQNPYAIMYCAERDFTVPGALPLDEFPWVTNALTISEADIDVLTMGGAHFGQPAAVAYYRAQDPLGRWMPPPAISNTSMWLPTGGSRTWTMVGLGNQTPDTTPSHQVTETGPIARTLPFAPTTARPFLSGTLPVMGALRFTSQWGGDSYQNFDGVQHVQSVNDLRISHTLSAGTALMTLSATNGLFNQQTNNQSNPFVAGTTWSLPTSGIYYPQLPHDSFAAAGLFGITTNADGTATLTAGAGLASQSTYYIQLRATAPAGTIADFRYLAVTT